jgi:hypothetical protein
MLESHISQLASSVPTANLSKIPGQPEELEFANLVNIYSADLCSRKTEEGPRWTDWGMPAKIGDQGRLVLTITIEAYTFKNALCDFGSSVNIMPKVIYIKNQWFTFIVYNHVLAACRPITLPPRGHRRRCMFGGRTLLCGCRLHCCRDWGSENAPIILGRPFLATAKAIIYGDTAKIIFSINGRKEGRNSTATTKS